MIYKKMYLLLFNRMTDALKALENCDYGQAAKILRTAQTEAEALYISSDEDQPFR